MNAANTFTGSVKVEKGAVTFNNASSFGASGNVVALGLSDANSATLVSSSNANNGYNIVVAGGNTGGLTIGTISTSAFTAYSGSITLNGNVSVTSPSTTNAMTISAPISGVGGITKVGAGITALTGANTYEGNTIISSGRLNIAANSIPDGPGRGDVSLTASGTFLQLTANEGINGLHGVVGSTVRPSTAANRTLTVGNGNANSTFSGKLENNGAGLLSLAKVGSGLTVLNGSEVSTSTGTLRSNYNGGTLRLDFANLATPTDLMNAGMNLQMSSGAFEILGKSTGATSQTFNALNLAVNVGHDNTLLLTPNGGAGTTLTITSPSPVSGLRLVGNNLNFKVTGGTGGTFNWDYANTNGIMGGWAVMESQTWAVGGTPVTGLPDASYVSTTTHGNTALNYQPTDHIDVTSSPTLDGGITVDTLRFKTAGAHTLALQGNNYIQSGGILVSSGVGNNLTTITGGTLAGNGFGSPSTNARVEGNNVVTGAELVVHQFNTANRVDIASEIVDGFGGVTGFVKNGPGVVRLSQNNSYSGVTMIANGTLQVNAANAIPHGSTKGNVSVNGVLDLNGQSITINAIDIRPAGTVTSSVAGNVTLTLGDGNGDALSGSSNGFIINDGATLSDGAGVVALRKIGTGQLTNLSPLTYSGGTTVEDGRLFVTGPNAMMGGGDVSILGGVLEIAAGVKNAIANSSTLSLAGGGTAGTADVGYAILGAGINEQVTALILGGISKAVGTYGSTASGALFQDDEFFSGSGMITVAAAMLAGDFNNDGKVNAADYVVWRKTMPGDTAKYNEWRANFGNPPGSGSGLGDSGSVPEPGAIVVLLTAAGCCCNWRRQRTLRASQ
jgi:autotransporter-associated beta strand protein